MGHAKGIVKVTQNESIIFKISTDNAGTVKQREIDSVKLCFLKKRLER